MAEKPEIKTPYKDRIGPYCVGHKDGKKLMVKAATLLMTCFLLTAAVKGTLKGVGKAGAAVGKAVAKVVVVIAR